MFMSEMLGFSSPDSISPLREDHPHGVGVPLTTYFEQAITT
jgi:hypothetical protein